MNFDLTNSDATNSIQAVGKIAVRRAVIADGLLLCDLFSQLGYPASVSDFLRRLEIVLSDPAQAVLVAGDPDQPVGCAHVGRLVLLEADGYAQLLALVVDEANRGRGVGTALVRAAERWARAHGCLTLTVRTNVVRLRTHAFYERLGYTRVKTQHTYRRTIGTEAAR